MADHTERQQPAGGCAKRQVINEFDHEARQHSLVSHLHLKVDRFALFGFLRAGADYRQTLDQPVRP